MTRPGDAAGGLVEPSRERAQRPLPVLDAHGAIDHAAGAAAFTADEARTGWHDGALWFVREKRDRAAAMVPEWEALRELASSIKTHTLSRLDEYLVEFERAATARGIVVHWARDAGEHNRIVHGILAARGARRLVKSKSMLTEECGLNVYLAARGVEVIDTDLGERIVQLRGEPPSHIVMPAIHLKKEEIGATFHALLGTPAGLADPDALTAAARVHLRERFLSADAALTGVNFGIAETGGIVVCTNEGNADLGTALAPVHIASMGIEKLIPRARDLGVFLRLLARSATGQASTVYASHMHAPRPGQALHVVLVDNGRSQQLGRADFWGSLKCIRCAACLNTCPVYRRSGGYSYGATVSGPIGSVLTPGLDLHKYAALLFASTLCGSCTAVCPVKVDLDAQLYKWRQQVTAAGYVPASKAWLMRRLGTVLADRELVQLAGTVARTALRLLPARIARRLAGAWGRTRALPEAPTGSFRDWYRTHRPPR
ncbi:MAG: lactate utilization protein B [Gemmatimonadota bacterium]